MKSSLLTRNCLNGTLMDEFKNYTNSKDIWKVLNNRYIQPALFVELVLKEREHMNYRTVTCKCWTSSTTNCCLQG
jgi:hypothetical protein